MLKALSVLYLFTLLSWLFGYVEKRLDKKAKVTPRSMTSQTGQQTIAMHVLLDISRSKGNQAMKFGQLKEYKVTNIFLQKSCRKWGRKASSRRPFDFK